MLFPSVKVLRKVVKKQENVEIRPITQFRNYTS